MDLHSLLDVKRLMIVDLKFVISSALTGPNTATSGAVAKFFIIAKKL
jgi:hypothetical protein